MNHISEQKDELEALESIYFNEIKVISKKVPITFSIEVRSQASNYEENFKNIREAADDDESADDSDEDGSEPELVQRLPSVTLSFQLPPQYPDEKPIIEIVTSQNLDEEDLTELLDLLDQKAQESLGTIMVFMLVSDVVEWLAIKGESDAIALEEKKQFEADQQRIEDVKRCDGTPVTEETFLNWKAKFDAEILKAKLEKQKQIQAEQGAVKRLTGREMFESDKTLAESDLNFIEDLDQGQLEALMHQIDEFEVGEDDEEEYEVADSSDDDHDEEFSDEDEATDGEE